MQSWESQTSLVRYTFTRETACSPGASKHILCTVAKFIVPDRGDKVDSGIELSYLPGRLHRLTGRFHNPVLETTISTFQGL